MTVTWLDQLPGANPQKIRSNGRITPTLSAGDATPDNISTHPVRSNAIGPARSGAFMIVPSAQGGRKGLEARLRSGGKASPQHHRPARWILPAITPGHLRAPDPANTDSRTVWAEHDGRIRLAAIEDLGPGDDLRGGPDLSSSSNRFAAASFS